SSSRSRQPFGLARSRSCSLRFADTKLTLSLKERRTLQAKCDAHQRIERNDVRLRRPCRLPTQGCSPLRQACPSAWLGRRAAFDRKRVEDVPCVAAHIAHL